MVSSLSQTLFTQSDWLTVPDYLPPSTWTGHTPFAMFLIERAHPRLFVELGTHFGTSYCAFCQAIKASGSHTKAYAVDTWQGDKHAGEYDEDVLNQLRAEHDPKYGHFSDLLQMTFNEAVDRFEDNSIDLLHIDGLHTYEAVRQDFETWLPKLSDRAIVLFHDTNERMEDFGVWELWAELRQTYPGFEFLHEHGLGVLAVGENIPEEMRFFFQLNDQEIELARQIFSAVGDRNASMMQEKRSQARIEGFLQEIDKARAFIHKMNEDAQKKQDVIKQNKDFIDQLQTRINALDVQVHRLNDQIHLLRNENTNLTRQLDELRAAPTTNQQTIDAQSLALDMMYKISHSRLTGKFSAPPSSEEPLSATTPFTKRLRELFVKNNAPTGIVRQGADKQRILIIIPFAVNYFYRLLGTRVAEALKNSGHDVVLSHLHIDHADPFDWVMYVNPHEIVQGYATFNQQGTASDAEKRITMLNEQYGRSAMILIESAGTHWFSVSYDYFKRLKMDAMLDIGLHTQEHLIPAELKPRYRYVYNGFTVSEKNKLSDHIAKGPTKRMIDWAFVGMETDERLSLIDRLHRELSSNGFAYMMSRDRLEALTPESSHIQHREFQVIQEMAKYVIWCAHHEHFYMEPQRFREAALAGALPIKVMLQPYHNINFEIPFSYLLVDNHDAINQIKSKNYEDTLHQFQQECLARPSLESTVQEALVSLTQSHQRALP